MWRNVHRTTRLPSGLVVVTAAAPHMASISLGLWVGAGGRYEPAELNGAAHFIEHMLFKGTTRRAPREISQAVEGIGGYLNAFTSEETTCYYSKALHNRLPELLDVLMDMAINPRFAPADIDLEREVIQEEIAMCLEDPHQHVSELINETLWPDHPLGRPLAGTAQSLKRLRREELLAFKRQHYVASNVVVAAAGNLDHDAVVRAVSRYADEFPAGAAPRYLPVISDQDKPRVRLFTKDVSQTQLILGIRACSRHDERRHALRILNVILGENMSSRLFQELREERGLAYQVASSVSFFHDAGTLDISMGLDTDNVPSALRLTVRELKRLAASAPPAVEVGRARDYVLGQIALSLENTESQMNFIGEQWLGAGRLVHPEEIKKRLAAVTPAEVRAAARDFFRPERYNLALVSPLRNPARLKAALAA